jgi:hypothetical protein
VPSKSSKKMVPGGCGAAAIAGPGLPPAGDDVDDPDDVDDDPDGAGLAAAASVVDAGPLTDRSGVGAGAGGVVGVASPLPVVVGGADELPAPLAPLPWLHPAMHSAPTISSA